MAAKVWPIDIQIRESNYTVGAYPLEFTRRYGFSEVNSWRVFTNTHWIAVF